MHPKRQRQYRCGHQTPTKQLDPVTFFEVRCEDEQVQHNACAEK